MNTNLICESSITMFAVGILHEVLNVFIRSLESLYEVLNATENQRVVHWLKVRPCLRSILYHLDEGSTTFEGCFPSLGDP